MVRDRIAGAPFADGTEFLPHARPSGPSELAHQALAERVDYGFGEAFAGGRSEFTRQTVGFRMFDA
jgi:hypothetical protein